MERILTPLHPDIAKRNSTLGTRAYAADKVPFQEPSDCSDDWKVGAKSEIAESIASFVAF